MSGLFAVHENIYATQEVRKKSEHVQVYGTDMEEEASLWCDVGERSVLENTIRLCGH